MATYLTHKSQIIPNEEQKQLLYDLSNQARLMYNILNDVKHRNHVLVENHKDDTGREYNLIVKKSQRGNNYFTTKADRKTGCVCHKNDVCQFKKITKFDLYQTLKILRNHTKKGCDETCPFHHRYWEFYKMYSDDLDLSANALLDSSWKSFFSLIKKDPKARPPGFKGYKPIEKFGMLHPIYTRKNFGQEIDIEKEKVGLKYFTSDSRYRSNTTWFKLKTPIYGFAKRNEKSRGILFKGVNQIVFSFDDVQNKYFVSIQCEFENVPEYTDNGKYLAIDLGLNNLVAWINSHAGGTGIIKNKRFEQYWNPRYEKRMSQRDKCQTTYVRPQTGEIKAFNHHPNRCQNDKCTHKKAGWKVWKRSNKWHYYNNHVKWIKRKNSNQFKDWQHWASQQIVNNTRANTIIIGKLNVKAMGKSVKGKGKYRKKGLNMRLLNHGTVARFVELLAYKARLVGKKVVKINEAYTTKTCWNCGDENFIKNSTNTHGDIDCKDCGVTTDRDINGAINIMAKFLDSEWSKTDLAEPQITRDDFLTTVRGNHTSREPRVSDLF